MHADRGRQVIDLVDVADQSAHERLVGHGAGHEREIEMIAYGGKVFDRAGRFVVDYRDAIVAGEQRLGQVAADEAGAAGDESVLHGL